MASTSTTIDPARGAAFDDAEVARCYLKRPPYPPELYSFLLELTPSRGRALDLGCGPGKIALELSPHFDRVDAVDPSAHMLALGRALANGRRNVEWIEATAEDAKLHGPYELIIAGASIHWMHHEVLFPKLARLIASGGLIAIVDGDGAFDPPWAQRWKEFMIKWIGIISGGSSYDECAFDAELRKFDCWMNVAGHRAFTFSFLQSVEDFISCQHSRATWARTSMGETRARAFDHELDALLRPYARGGILEYRVSTRLTWGTPRRVRAVALGSPQR